MSLQVSMSTTAVPLLTEVDPVLELKYKERLTVAVRNCCSFVVVDSHL